MESDGIGYGWQPVGLGSKLCPFTRSERERECGRFFQCKKHCIHRIADCKSMSLIYQLQCNVCNDFYIGETRRSRTAWMDNISPPQFHTQTYQLPSIPNPIRFHFKIVGLLVTIHKLLHSTPDHIHRQFEIAYQLVLQSHHTPRLNIR